MHEATKGNRLPSWGTTAEFVKACGADPDDYRERWERANQAVRTASAGDHAEPANVAGGAEARPARPPAGLPASAASAAERQAMHLDIGPPGGEASAVVPAPAIPPGGLAGGERPAVPGRPAGRERFRRARPAAVALATAAVGVGTVVLIVIAVNRDTRSEGDGGTAAARPAKAAPAPADCPVRATNPAPAPPAHKGDSAAFIADITLPDCTRVAPGRTVTKVWRLKNAGKVPWEGYSLRRLDLPQRADQCQTISDVPIKDTRPGAMVDVRADITTPRRPGLCYVRFKMVDASGKVAFPGSRPVNFQVIVE
ncbi:NBR1-Ig-like domain-containing protein [Spirillospora sp. NPDC029432]|uniref:NBR1-Ig-like domain-containing protein n=1 Tax=Spirillospora sp. NPDC029432 TaxID=3154599 RepID=UPI00345197EF